MPCLRNFFRARINADVEVHVLYSALSMDRRLSTAASQMALGPMSPLSQIFISDLSPQGSFYLLANVLRERNRTCKGRRDSVQNMHRLVVTFQHEIHF